MKILATILVGAGGILCLTGRSDIGGGVISAGVLVSMWA